MLISTRGTLRHPKFDECVNSIAENDPLARRAIDGAIWQIERDPRGMGVLIRELGLWHARVILPESFEILLIYSIAKRFVTMLTIMSADGRLEI